MFMIKQHYIVLTLISNTLVMYTINGLTQAFILDILCLNNNKAGIK